MKGKPRNSTLGENVKRKGKTMHNELLKQAAEEKCSWGNFPRWVYEQRYDHYICTDEAENMSISDAERWAKAKARADMKSILHELSHEIARGICAIDPDYCSEWDDDMQWTQPWAWKCGPVTDIEQAIRTYFIS